MDARANVVAVIQARLGSSRLPGKVLADIGGRPLLQRLIERARAAQTVSRFCVATTRRPEDNAIVALCERLGAEVVRGDTEDVLGRYLTAAELYGAEVVVRLTGDNPLIDSRTIDTLVNSLLHEDVAYARTCPTTCPHGLTAEVVTVAALREAARRAITAADREHVTSYIIRRPDRFPRLDVACDFPGAGQRWTVDTAEDLERVRSVFSALARGEMNDTPAGIASWMLNNAT